jgi:hypothetical protein
VFNSCASIGSVAQKISIESGEIPPDMKNKDFILIGVLIGKRSYDKYVLKEFEKYTGNYILATESEIEEKYNDVKKYRYIMNYQMEQGSIQTYNSNSRYGKPAPGVDFAEPKYSSQNTTGFRYYLIDRLENKTYTRNSRSSFYAKEMRAYLQAIDRIRMK